MVSRSPAWWLVAPGRFAGIGRVAARWWLAALSLTIVAAVIAPPRAVPIPAEILHDSIVAAMRHGGAFYDGLRDLLRAEPDARAAILYPPALAVVAALVPGWAMVLAVAGALTIVMWNGGTRLAGMFARSPGAVLAVVLLAAGVVAGALLWSEAPHAGWAAILSAIAVLVRRRAAWVYAGVAGCVAAVIDPAALPVVLAMAVLALVDGTRREAIGWMIAAVVAAVVLGVHLWAIDALHAPVGPNSFPGGSFSGGSFSGGAVPRLIAAACPGVPMALAAPIVLLAAFGWATIGDPLGWRVVAVMVVGVALDGVAGLRGATVATVLVVPGVAFVPGAIGDLLRAALDRRRITVTRVTR